MGSVAAPPSSLNIIDTLALFSVSEWAKENSARPAPVAYAELLSVLASARQELQFRSADVTFAVAAVDPLSESQRRFLHALKQLRIEVDGIDYRHAYVSVPRMAEKVEHPISSVAPQLCYVLGLLANRKNPEAMIVTSSFDIYWPLMDFKRRGGKVAIAYFRRFLDSRFSQVGLFDSGSEIEFIDLEPHAVKLLGIELSDRPASSTWATGGLASI